MQKQEASALQIYLHMLKYTLSLAEKQEHPKPRQHSVYNWYRLSSDKGPSACDPFYLMGPLDAVRQYKQLTGRQYGRVEYRATVRLLCIYVHHIYTV